MGDIATALVFDLTWRECGKGVKLFDYGYTYTYLVVNVVDVCYLLP